MSPKVVKAAPFTDWKDDIAIHLDEVVRKMVKILAEDGKIRERCFQQDMTPPYHEHGLLQYLFLIVVGAV